MKKGFTLAELLAVIVLLSVLALIAVPVILDIIKDTRKDSAVRSAELYIDAAENVALYRETAGTGKREVEIGVVYNHEVLEEVFELKVDGSIPSEDSWVIFDKYGVADYSLKFGNYIISYNEETEKDEVTEGNNVKVATYSTFNLGDKVKLSLGSDTSSTWNVINITDSSTEEYITLIKGNILEASVTWTEAKTTIDNYISSLNINKYLDSQFTEQFVSLPTIKEILGTTITDYNHFLSANVSGGSYWTSTSDGGGDFWCVDTTGYQRPKGTTLRSVRPVIKVSKKILYKV